MAKAKDRPGVMLYFDAIRPAITRLDDAQCGALLRSVMDYAQYGVVPELDAMTGMAFDMLVPKIDRDAERYEESREQRQYAAYAREKKKCGESFLSFAEWQLFRARSPEKNNGPLSPVNENNGPSFPVNENNGPYPSASASVSASVSAATSAAAYTAAVPTGNRYLSKNIFSSRAGAEEAAGEGYKGEGEGGTGRRLYTSFP